MPARDRDLLIEAALNAGRIAGQFSGLDAQRWDKAGGAGPVTEADLAVNRMLAEFLQSRRPGYGWLSEESEDTAERLDREHVFIIDPIDGTRSFVDGSRTWAHSLAVARAGRISAAVVYLPQRDLLYAAAAGSGATLNGVAIRVSDTLDLVSAKVLAARPNLDAHHWRGGAAPRFRREYRPSLAYRIALVAQGRFDAMMTLRPSWEWDIAAGDLILREAGGLCTDRTGTPLRFNNRRPLLNGVIGAGGGLHGRISDALDPHGPGITP